MESRKEAFKASIVQQIRRGNGGNLNNSYEAIPETNVFSHLKIGEIPNLETTIFRGELLVSGRVSPCCCAE